MREPILMPTLSDTMERGQLIEWLKQPGDAVKKGEALAEVETDKAVMDLEAFYDGYLAGPLAAADSEQPVGAVIGYIVDSTENEKREKREKGKEGEPVSQTKTERPTATPASVVPQAVSASENNTHDATITQPAPKPPRMAKTDNSAIPSSPYARGLARELGLDLSQLSPGPDGVVRASQVMAAALRGPQANLAEGPAYQIQPLTPMQRAVASNMTAAAATPVFHISARFSLEPLHTMAQNNKRSLTLLLARACALSVAAHPRFNALYTPQGLAQRQQIDVGIAVDVPNGLVTPVLRDAAVRPLDELAEDWRMLKDRVTGKVHRHRLAPEDYRGATIYLSNLGMFGTVAHFDAVVPQGASAILAVAAVQDGKAEFTLSCDHRVVYGADAARFMTTLAAFLDAPGLLVTAVAHNLE